MSGITGINFAPLIPWEAVAILSGIGLVLLLYALFRGARGSFLRMAALAILALALMNPHLQSESREGQNDIALVVLDESSSQNAGNRREQLQKAREEVLEELGKYKDLDVRVIQGKETKDGTFLFEEFNRALADLPKGRFAGAIMITDGQVHDAPLAEGADGGSNPNAAKAPELDAPMHVLLTGDKGERDRRLIVEKSPAFGIVGKTIKLQLKIEDRPDTSAGSAPVTVRIDGGNARRFNLPVGESKEIEVPMEHGGATIIELEAAAMPNEMSLINNRAVITVNGVRDRLRVLLVSGQPHLGERTWRNLLKSDPSVDLVHFTILRPPEKNDFTPLNELALISFPIRELFEIKLKEFDLIVFDRYVVRFVLPQAYFRNIQNYVREGGAVLAAVGPDFAGVRSMIHTPLGEILPGDPNGPILEGAFKATLTDKGRRHPVTAGLPGDGGKKDPTWGHWFRQIDAISKSGHTLLNGAEGKPLLILDRVGKGRIAQFMSDHIWLWAKGYDGGGPHAELLRRLSHWLMKEPDLEEEDLRAVVNGDQLTILRRSLDPAVPPITVTPPSGRQEIVRLTETKDGAATATIKTTETGLYRIEDGRRRTMTAVGRLNPPELADLRASPDKLASLVKISNGGVAWIADGVPDFRRTKPGRSGAGRGWLGMQRNGAYVVTGVRQISLMPALAFLLLVCGAIMFSWWREGQ